MVEQLNIEQLQRPTEFIRDLPVCGAGIQTALRMVVGNDDGNRMVDNRTQRNDACVNGCSVDTAIK